MLLHVKDEKIALTRKNAKTGCHAWWNSTLLPIEAYFTGFHQLHPNPIWQTVCDESSPANGWRSVNFQYFVLA